jgi:hypothetical protein
MLREPPQRHGASPEKLEIDVTAKFDQFTG